MAYTHEQQLEMLRYAKKHGVKNASRHFGVSLRSLAMWNKKYNVYPVRLPRQYTTEQKYNILGARTATDRKNVQRDRVANKRVER